jgi:CubicO group peptidase (beta-lactamase class C family)
MMAIPDLFQGLFDRSGIVGLSGAIFDAKGVIPFAFGEGGHGPVDATTRFPIASCTKPLTASAVCGLAEAGLLDLDRPVRTWIPDFRLHDPEATEEMTPRDVLCHRSGLPPHTWAWVYGELDRAAFIRERLPHLESTGPFREGYRYSNIAYAIAGHLVQAVAGMEWERFVGEEIFARHGMHHTRHLDEGWMDTEHLALPHAEGRRMPGFAAKARHLIAPASEVMSTAPDLATWLQAHIADPVFHRMTQAQVPIDSPVQPNKVLGPLHYGLGWRLDTIHGESHVWHSGLCSGYSAWMSVMPARKSGLVLLANSNRSLGWLKSMAYGFFHPAIDWTSCFVPAQTDEAPAKTCETGGTPEGLDGVYLNAGYGSFRIQGDRAWFQGRGPIPLTFSSREKARFTLPEYASGFNLDLVEDGLAIDFEPALAPIRFGKQDE